MLSTMNITELTPISPDFPVILKTIPSPPTVLYTVGAPLSELTARPRVTIVGSRRISAYGRAITTQLAGELARQGVVIVSGLAFGVDAIAHQAALEAGGLTIAVLPCGLDTICPRAHYSLALRIIKQGGALITEYPAKAIPHRYNFVARNRIASGLSQITLITEAAAKSGSLHTAQFALEQGREVMAVPGNITSATSAGPNHLIKTGAAPVTEADDILHILGIRPAANHIPAKGDTPQQQAIIDLIAKGETDGAVILHASNMDASTFNQNITMLELSGKIRSLGNNTWALM